MNVWAQVLQAEARQFDQPGRWLRDAHEGLPEFTRALLRSLSEAAAWPADSCRCDLDDPDDLACVTAHLAGIEELVSMLRVGVAEAMTKAARDA